MKVDFKEMGRNIGGFASKYSPEILTGIGITGMIVTTVMAVNATPKALRIMDENRKEEADYQLTKLEVVKLTWKCYIPSIMTGVMSTSCIIGASSVNAKRNAALATAYTLSETALKGYREKVISTLGEEKDREIRDSVSKDKFDSRSHPRSEVLIAGSKNDILCYDAAFGREFRSDIDKINRVETLLNKRMLSEMYISLNDFYYELGIEGTEVGDDVGWNIEDGFLDIHYTSSINENNELYVIIDYHVAPKHRFDRA
ncbi:MAG: DUF6353 family protein [Vallitaleaceae bacterium]|nr:DUF6353 family protein [Vallitaleaceae bacterium]